MRVRRRSFQYYALMALLVLGTVLRPVLIMACDLHAALHAHPGNAHDHSVDVDTGDPPPDRGHGPHDRTLLGDAAVAVPSYWLPAPAPVPGVVPSHASPPLPAGLAAELFRPPIA